MYPYFDAHCDTLSRCAAEGWSLWENPGHLDLKRLTAYGPANQVFALYLDSEEVPPEARFAALEAQVAVLRREQAAGRWGDAFLSVEGAELLNCDETLLPVVKDWGVQWVNLTWNHPNALSGSCRTGEGLTEKGRSFARRCWALGMGTDVSHLSDRGFWDLLEIQEGPILASHSDCRALCDHPRNLTDEMAKALVAAGGFIGLNFCVNFLGEHSTADTVVAHLEHFLELVGEDHVGLGGDFDGTDVPEDLSGVQDLPHLWEALYRRNYPEHLIQKIAYQNLSRFLGR